MPEARLYSIAAIAKVLDQPESTLHYWKNRFDAFLPSVGEGRHKRFRPEALDIFKTIHQLLRQGLSAADVRVELSRLFPMNVTPGGEPGESGIPAPGPMALPSQETAALIGREIALAIGKELRGMLAAGGDQPLALEGMDTIKDELTTVKMQTEELLSKMKVLEAELTRLRKDGRDMEKYLLDKISAAKAAK